MKSITNLPPLQSTAHQNPLQDGKDSEAAHFLAFQSQNTVGESITKFLKFKQVMSNVNKNLLILNKDAYINNMVSFSSFLQYAIMKLIKGFYSCLQMRLFVLAVLIS